MPNPTQPQPVIRLAIYGAFFFGVRSGQVYDALLLGSPGSGKTSLRDALDGCVHRGARSAKSFTLEAELQMPAAKAPFMAIITLDATKKRSRRDIQSLVETSRTLSSATTLCFVLTKMDLIPSGVCQERINCLSARVSFAESFGSDTLFTSVVTLEGLDELRNYIGQWFSLVHHTVLITVILVNRFCPPAQSFSISESLYGIWRTCHSGWLDVVDEELSTIRDDDDVERLRKSSAAQAWNEHLQRVLDAPEPQDVPANRITKSLIAKWPTSSERACLEYVRRHTSIPVPRAFRPDLSCLVMDLIEGENLLECWGKLSRFMQFRVACTLRLYVKQLCSLTSSRLGGPENGRLSGLLFQDQAYGPFPSTLRFQRFCEHVVFTAWEALDARKCAPGAPLPPIPQCNGNWDPVFVHGDLNPSNLILDKRNTLWIVDWATAGFYPAFMESQAMRFLNDRVWGGNFDKIPRSWRQYREFIAGKTAAEDDKFWDYFESTVYRFGGDPYV
ncbi:hypothetical protein K525DRAFT_205665 [Schizophyllum commune Loenen D]|nr:hypothetical protein K525DRAFT_205665 [Schizophyllum commune Loenen D]